MKIRNRNICLRNIHLIEECLKKEEAIKRIFDNSQDVLKDYPLNDNFGTFFLLNMPLWVLEGKE